MGPESVPICPSVRRKQPPKRHLASGRGRDRHRRQETLALAGRRSGWLRARRIVQTRRNTTAAKRLLTRLLKKQGMAPKRMITDKLSLLWGSQAPGHAECRHRSHKGLNNRAENSHLPLESENAVLQGFRSAGSLKRLTLVFSAVRNLFVPPNSHQSAPPTHLHRLRAMTAWKAAAGVLA